MRMRHTHLHTSRLCRRIWLLASAALLLTAFSLSGQATEEIGGVATTLEIENPTFKASGLERMPIESWKFESIKVNADAVTLELDFKISKTSENGLSILNEGGGAIIACRPGTDRVNLVSTAFEIPPFHWVDVTVAYQVEEGEPVPFVCLRPRDKREQIDLAFLPCGSVGKKQTATLKLHSGISDDYYVLSMACIGEGSVRFLSVRGEVGEKYPRPEKPVFILDMMHVKPTPTSKLGWDSANKFVTVFGFPSVESLHYSEVTAEKLEEIDPALIILSPMTENLPPSEFEAIDRGARATLNHDAPVVGICLGHQILAMVRGGELGAAIETGPNGKRTVLWEWGPTMIKALKEDPVFAGLPRYPYFCASESHRGIVCGEVEGAVLLASTDHCETQVFRYEGKPWYTFQAHIEREWEYACPEAYLLWKNMLRYFFLAP